MDRKTVCYYNTANMLSGGGSYDFGVRRPANKQMFVRRISWSIHIISPETLKTNPYSDGNTCQFGLRMPTSPNVVDENGGATNQGYFQIDMKRNFVGQMEFDNYPIDNGTFTFDWNNSDAVVQVDFTAYVMIELEFR